MLVRASATQVVGALPLVGAMLQQWGLADIVDQVAPWDGDVPLGTLVEVLVTNRLLTPQAMYAVGNWATAAAVTDYFGLTTEQLNDDRLGSGAFNERILPQGLRPGLRTIAPPGLKVAVKSCTVI